MQIGFTPSKTAIPCTGRSQSDHTFIDGGTLFMPPMTENTIFWRGLGSAVVDKEQGVHVQLIPDSPEEDPVVRITVTDARSGDTKYDFTRRIKDIDPRNASYAEAAALAAWEDKVNPNEKIHAANHFLPVAPADMWIGDVMKKQNFVDACSRSVAARKLGPNLIAQAKDLLSFYRKVVSDGKFSDDETKAGAASRKAMDKALQELMDALKKRDFPNDDITAYSAYRRLADDALLDLLDLV